MERKVDFLAVDNPTSTKFTVHILAAVAEFERDAISKRTSKHSPLRVATLSSTTCTFYREAALRIIAMAAPARSGRRSSNRFRSVAQRPARMASRNRATSACLRLVLRTRFLLPSQYLIAGAPLLVISCIRSGEINPAVSRKVAAR
jgi:hypothetical protein